MTKDYILFDLDGTLTDPEEGITNSVAYALGRFGIPVENRKSLDVFIGPPLDDSFMEYYGFDREKALRAISVFREYFRDRGIFENVVYPRIPEMLDGLKKSGKTLILATSKPEVFAVRILDRFGLSQYFTVVTGSLLDNTRTDKHEVIEAALEKAGVTDRTRAVMVGDREHDIIGAKKSSLASVGVTYGYGSREELAQAGADLICRTPEEFTKIMLSEQQEDKRMNATERKIAEDLLSIRAVFFRPDEPFTWASGIKSPVYCDNRLILTAPDVRTEVETAIMQTIEREYPQAEVLMGTSTAGIAHAAIVGHMMKLPMGYVRGSSKDHGRQNQIEGRLEKGQKVVVVEDLVSTGGSVLDVVKVLRAAGAEVLGVVSIFTYGMKKGLERLAAANVKNVSLTNFDVIAAVAAEQNYIKQEDVVRLIQFRNNPADESWIGGNN